MQITQQTGSSHQISEAFCTHTPSPSPLGTVSISPCFLDVMELLPQWGYQVSGGPGQMAQASLTVCAQPLQAAWGQHIFYPEAVNIKMKPLTNLLWNPSGPYFRCAHNNSSICPDTSVPLSGNFSWLKPRFPDCLPGLQNLSQSHEPSS